MWSRSCGWNVRWPAREVASILLNMLFLISDLISCKELVLDDGLIWKKWLFVLESGKDVV